VKVTKKHFKVFGRECTKWIRFFGLKEWNIIAVRRHLDDEGALASCHADYCGRIANLVIDDDWGSEPVTNELLEICAFHEVCELLLAKLAKLAEAHYAKNIVEEEIHVIIRKLESSLFKAYTDKKYGKDKRR